MTAQAGKDYFLLGGLIMLCFRHSSIDLKSQKCNKDKIRMKNQTFNIVLFSLVEMVANHFYKHYKYET